MPVTIHKSLLWIYEDIIGGWKEPERTEFTSLYGSASETLYGIFGVFLPLDVVGDVTRRKNMTQGHIVGLIEASVLRLKWPGGTDEAGQYCLPST